MVADEGNSDVLIEPQKFRMDFFSQTSEEIPTYFAVNRPSREIIT